MSKQRFVTIQKDDLVGECLPSAVEVWEQNGWTVVDDGVSKEGETVQDVDAQNAVQPAQPQPQPQPAQKPVSQKPADQTKE